MGERGKINGNKERLRDGEEYRVLLGEKVSSATRAHLSTEASSTHRGRASLHTSCICLRISDLGTELESWSRASHVLIPIRAHFRGASYFAATFTKPSVTHPKFRNYHARRARRPSNFLSAMASSGAQLVECVPNVSEGRRASVVEALASAIRETAGCRLLDVDAGESSNRTVYTFVGDREAVVNGAVNLARAAFELVDMRRHHGGW